VLVAQAGAHQVWQFDPDTQAASAWLGTGSRGLRDGGDDAAFAEPGGLAIADETLFVADAGSGALRAVDLAHQFVRTVATGLQRPSAVIATPHGAYCADAWAGTVARLAADGAFVPVFGAEQGLVEPVALACDGERLWIADAAADCLFVGDLPGPGPLRRVDVALPVPARSPDAAAAQCAASVELLEFADVTLRVPLPLPPGHTLDTAAPATIDCVDEGDPVLAAARRTAPTFADGRAVVLLPVAAHGEGCLRVRIAAMLRATDGASRAFTWHWVVPVRVSMHGAIDVEVAAAVSP
jgi:hypothetical protein